MLFLSFMRHADSECINHDGIDFKRPISKRGQKKTIVVSEFVKKNKIKFDLIFYSPTERTKQTLNYFLKYTGYENLNTIEDKILYDGNAHNFLLKISQVKKFKRILLITHEPLISYFIDFFLSKTEYSKKTKSIKIITSSITTIKFDIKNWNQITDRNAEFHQFLDPDLLPLEKNNKVN